MAIGDLHLGRRPRHLPEGLSDHGIDVRTLTPATAWQRAVDVAIEEKLEVVLLAGDVVESLEDRFEAYAHLERGVQRLVDAGIRVLGVTGNHDVIALPRLARQLSGFHLLGEGGEWECADLDLNGKRLRVVGWSFPKRHHAENPLLGFPVLPDDGVCTLGLLHCDLDAHKSEYAPVSKGELANTSCDAWLLGHIHNPTELRSPRPIGYLGSVAGLDPGEPGARGPWLIEAHAKGNVEVLRQLCVSPLRYERQVVDCSDWGELGSEALEDRLEGAVHEALDQVHERLRAELANVRVVAVRILLRGKTAQHLELSALLRRLPFDELIRPLDGVLYFPEKLIDELAPAIELEQLAQAADPPGLLARKLLVLGSESQEADELIARMQREVASVEQKSALWSGLSRPKADVRARALRCGMRALEELLQQQAPASAR